MNTDLSESTWILASAAPAYAGEILQVGPLMPTLEDDMQTRYGAIRLPDGDGRQAFLDQYSASVRVIVTSGRVGVDAVLMDRLPKLKAIINFGVGYDTTDVVAAASRGIVISNTPDVLNDCVADTALALFLDVFRRTTEADRYIRRGEWTHGNFPLAVKASGKRIGIVGLGRIGLAVAARLEGFNTIISYHNRRELEDVSYSYVSSLEVLAANSDALIVTVSGGPQSTNLINSDVLKALGPDGYLINIARGSVVDEVALVAALLNGEIAGAGLDVFADEPRVPHALFELDNVVLLPHVASGTIETRRAMAELTMANLQQFLEQGTLLTPIGGPR